jgi:hypothetical protein
MVDVIPDYSPDDGAALLDPDFDDSEGWLPDWLPRHLRDNSMDDWI